MRRTKIVATLGPASESAEKIESLIMAGADVFRFNMKHGNLEWHSDKMRLTEKIAASLGRRVAMLIDLQGPEVRVDGLPKSPFMTEPGQRFWFVAADAKRQGVILDHPGVIRLVKVGYPVLADDGFLEFKVVKVEKEGFEVEVVEGGELKDRKTVNFPGISLNFPCLVEKDLELLSLAARMTVDYVALSFVRDSKDIEVLRQEMNKLKVDCGIIAKIEHPDAVSNFEEILAAADGIMVARGDLGIEYPIEEVPALQKMIVHRCLEEGKPVIIATQMLESMINYPRPTRAEVSDVANAVYDRADAVMLSGESAAGKYPVRSVKMMAAITDKTEASAGSWRPVSHLRQGCQGEALVAAAQQLAETYTVDGERISSYVVLTETGKTAQFLARLRPNLPIFALSKEKKTLDRLKLVWGIEPIFYDYEKDEQTDTKTVLSRLVKQNYLHSGQKVIVIYGEQWGQPGQTSVVRVQEV